MDLAVIGIILAIFFLSLLGSGFWVALSLTAVGILGFILDGNTSIVGGSFATDVWGATTGWSLAALPLFIWMGEILFRTKLSEDLFQGLAPWLKWLPGRLLHVNILSCGVFAAVSGSSAATAATIGRMTLPELKQRGYGESISIGTLAGSGTLGLLIPPSIILIVYGVAAEVSIGRLFIAGAIPGLLLVIMFMLYTVIYSLVKPDSVPKISDTDKYLGLLPALVKLLPIALLIGGVIGSIFVGFATPTEAAACGVVGSLILSALTGSFTVASFKESLLGGVKTSCMIGFIIAGAAFLSKSMALLSIPRELAEWINTLGLSPTELLIYLTILFVLLGCFLDGISVVVLTTSVVLPMVQAAGIDPLWFGIFIVIVVEMSQITPPVGFNLFVIQGLTGKNILYVARAAFPFFLTLLFALVIITIFKGIVLWLPALMLG